ncbi:Uncharacterized protein MLTONO_p0140 (plasmid) [Mesorhizobium loti]|nr:Uncharacterized protein MLTONO_p0140 [Mesorhizobium loti]
MLLFGKIGVADDRSYSPTEAQSIIEANLEKAAQSRAGAKLAG